MPEAASFGQGKSLYGEAARLWPENAWLKSLCEHADAALAGHNHGDLPAWKQALTRLPNVDAYAALDQAAPVLGHGAKNPQALTEQLMCLHPWRKGPLTLGGVTIDTEWRSDWKWERVSPHVNLEGHRVLDIGSGNGYFGWRMLGAGARLVIGIDPTLVFVMQWLACRHFAGPLPNYVLPLGIEHLPDLPANLDTVFSMGVLYHRKDPHHHLKRIHSLLKPGGTIVLETLVLPVEQESAVLQPQKRYSRMRNVWAVPGTNVLLDWVASAGFCDAQLVDLTPTTVSEQRTTAWMRFESLEKALDPQDGSRTIEGFPAPIRATVVART